MRTSIANVSWPCGTHAGQAVRTIAAAVFFLASALPASATPLFVEQTASLGAQPCSGADIGCYTNYLQMADVTGNGKLDLLFANAKGYFSKINPAEPLVLLRNDGGFGFTDISANLGGGFAGWVRQIAIGDVNGDGSLDLFAPSAWGDADALFINDGTGHFTDEAASRIAALHSHAGATRFADVDGDGDLDLLIGDWGPSPLLAPTWSMHLWLNDGTGRFTNADARLPAAANLPPGTPVDLDVADVDGDFDLDLLIDTHNGSVQLWLNDGTGTFTDATASHFVATPKGLHYNPGACDVDGDGDLDVFVDNAPGSGANEQLLINDGTGHFTDGTAARLGAVGDAGSDDNGVACIDVNGDGRFDAAVASLTGNERVLINDGTGRFTLSPDAFPVVKDPTLWFDFGDLDGDGRLDAVTGQGEQPHLWINRLYVGTSAMVQDTLPPEFRAVESLPAQNAAAPVRVRFAVSDGATTDTGPRLRTAFVRYSVDGAAPLSVPATFMGGDLFRAVIPPTVVKASVSYEVCAVDLAGNQACAAAKNYDSEVASCAGDCDGSGDVAVTEVITMINIALGNPGSCPSGVPAGATVDIALILRAVNNALSGCTSSDLYVAASGTLSGDGSMSNPYRRITDAVARARVERATAAIPPEGKIQIHVAPGTYVGSFDAAQLQAHPEYEVLPIILNVPRLAVLGSTVLVRDDRGLPTATAPEGQTLLEPDKALSPNQYLFLVTRTADGAVGDGVTVDGFTLDGKGGGFPGSNVFVDRVSGFKISNNLAQHAAFGLMTRHASGTIEGNLLADNLELGSIVTGGSLAQPATVLVHANRATRNAAHGFGHSVAGWVKLLTDPGQNTLALLEPLQTVFDRNNPTDVQDIPDTLTVTLTGNDASDNAKNNPDGGIGIRLAGIWPDFDYSTADATQPVTSVLTADLSGNTCEGNGAYGVAIEAGDPQRIKPRRFVQTLTGRFEGNTFAGNARAAALFTFTYWRVSVRLNSPAEDKFAEESTYTVTDGDGELVGFDYDTPLTDPFNGSVLSNTLTVNGAEAAHGKHITLPSPASLSETSN